MAVQMAPLEGPSRNGDDAVIMDPASITAAGQEPALSVLLVEDDHTLRLVLSHLLSEASYEVTAVATAARAREIAHGTNGSPPHVDLIVCDVRLPDGRGDELAQELAPTLHARGVLLLSGARLPAEVCPGCAQAQTPTGFLRKPFASEELLGAMRALLA